MTRRNLYGRRRVLAALLVTSTLLLATPALAAPVTAPPGTPPEFAGQIQPPPPTSAASALLMDWQTGQILYAKYPKARRDPASTTKVLTALIVLERAKLDDKVKISSRAANTPGSTMHIKAGQVYSVHDLLHGLMMRSGNDAAVALAEHVAGSVAAFAELMNQKAKELGATESHFTNPHGLTDANHYTTAYDLALIARAALRDPRFSDMVATPARPLTYEELDRDVTLYNTNALLSSFPGADGVKTGTTSAAGRCLVASATRDRQRLLAVVLRAPNRWGDSARLLEWGFGNFRLASLGRQGDLVTRAQVEKGKPRRVPAVLGADVTLVLPKRADAAPEITVDLMPVQAPLRSGAPVGRLVVKTGEVVKAEAPLLAAGAVKKRGWLDALFEAVMPLLRDDRNVSTL